MSNYLDKWNEFIAEEDDVRDTYDDEVEKRNEKSRKQGAEKMGLEERCQKGYKTHPTQKTKKMYGKTYRNCIKAEGEELKKEESGGYTDSTRGGGAREKFVQAMAAQMQKKLVNTEDDGTYVKATFEDGTKGFVGMAAGADGVEAYLYDWYNI